MFIFGGNAYVPQNGVRLSVVEVAYEEKVISNIIDNVYFFLTPLYYIMLGAYFLLSFIKNGCTLVGLSALKSLKCSLLCI